MVNSLRGRWLAWLAVLLAAVLGGFGAALYVVTRQARFDEIDAELLAAARVLEGTLRSFTGPRPPDRPVMFPKAKEREKGPFDKDRLPLFLPPALDRERMERALMLPRTLRDRYADLEVPPYFAVWLADGTRLKALGDVPQQSPTLPEIDPGYYVTHRGGVHELIVLGPARSVIAVGRSVEREIAALRRLAIQIVMTGLGVFAVGVLGGWWISGRAIAPIQIMSATAERITADSPGQRMELTGAPTELAGLGEAVNTMLDRLEDAFAQQVRFTADASHELRTPLAVMLSHLELARAQPRSAEEYRETLATCERAARRMKSLTDGLLTLARVDAGRLELASDPVDLHDLAEETVALLARLAHEQSVTVDLRGDSVEVIGDGDRLAQVITNLVSNAIHYNRPGGSVTVTTRGVGDFGELEVRDTGVGIAADALPHVFERFYRVDAARSRDRGGSGLGLAISRGIVEAHGGTIAVESTPGEGSRFTIRLPRAGAGTNTL